MTKKGILLIATLIVLLAGALYLTPALAAGPYQAENAVLGGGAVVNSNYSGYTGTGFVNFPANGGYVEFRNVDGGTGGSGTLKFRHALGSTSARTGRLTVNGVSQNITFNPTGSWTTWAIKEVVVTLTSGTTNTIRLVSTGQDLANLDQLEVIPASLTPTATPVCEQPAPIYASTIVSPTSLQVNGTFNVSLTTTLRNPLITLYAGSDVVATCTGSCQGSGLTVVNGSPTVQFVTMANPFIFTLKAIAAGTTNIYVTVQGEDTIYRFDPEAGACRPFPVPGVSGRSQTVPVTAFTPTITPTPPACGAPIPIPSASLSVTPTTLNVGETAQVAFSSQNVGMPQYTLYAGTDRIAVFRWGGGVDVYNESPLVRLVSGSTLPAVLEAVAPGTADLRVGANGEVIVAWFNGCNPSYSFITVDSNHVPVSISTSTPTTPPPTTPPPTTPPPPPAPCFYTYTNQNDWGNGATINVTIRNNLPNTINGWTVTWAFPGSQLITNLWNGSYTQSGASVSVRDAGWNSTIGASGGTVSFGFNISYSGTNAAPARVSLNGNACQVIPY